MNSTKQVKRRILIADDDETFRNGLQHLLIAAGHDVKVTIGGHVAQQLLGRWDFDLVLSDINMPEGDGIELMRFMSHRYPHIPVILMTGLKSVVETRDAFEAGAKKLLPKPFTGEDLLGAINTIFNPKVEESEPIEKQFCSLPIDDFICGKEMLYDIYIRLSESNFFKIARGGANLRPEQIQAYRSRGISHLWLTKSDFRDYLKFSVRLGHTLRESSSIPNSRKIQFYQQTSRLLIEGTAVEHIDKEFVDQGVGIVDSVISILSENKEIWSILDFMNDQKDGLYRHSLSVALYSSLMALRLGWTSPATLFHIGAGGLFHDLGKKEIPNEIMTKNRMTQTSAERSLYETHPLRGAAILRAIPETPDEVIWIVQQHHENEAGCGYPARLKKNRIYPLAKLVCVADEFCEALEKEPKLDRATVRRVLQQLAKFSGGVLEPGMVGALMAVFDLDMPEELRHTFTSSQIASKKVVA